MSGNTLESKDAWLPGRAIKTGRASSFPPGSLLLYPSSFSEGGDFEFALRVGEASLVFCLTAMGGDAASRGDLVDVGRWSAAVLGIDASRHGLPILEFDPTARFVSEPSDDRRGGFLCLGLQGARLCARANASVVGVAHEASIDPVTWCVAPVAPPHERRIWLSNWRLRIRIEGGDALVFNGEVEPIGHRPDELR